MQFPLKPPVSAPEEMTQVLYDGEFHCAPIEKGWHDVDVELDEAVFFIRRGRLLPVGRAITNTSQYDVTDLTLLGDGESYELYTDDGLTRDCTLDNIRVLSGGKKTANGKSPY